MPVEFIGQMSTTTFCVEDNFLEIRESLREEHNNDSIWRVVTLGWTITQQRRPEDVKGEGRGLRKARWAGRRKRGEGLGRTEEKPEGFTYTLWQFGPSSCLVCLPNDCLSAFLWFITRFHPFTNMTGIRNSTPQRGIHLISFSASSLYGSLVSTVWRGEMEWVPSRPLPLSLLPRSF